MLVFFRWQVGDNFRKLYFSVIVILIILHENLRQLIQKKWIGWLNTNLDGLLTGAQLLISITFSVRPCKGYIQFEISIGSFMLETGHHMTEVSSIWYFRCNGNLCVLPHCPTVLILSKNHPIENPPEKYSMGLETGKLYKIIL